jgi:hypothetical protein
MHRAVVIASLVVGTAVFVGTDRVVDSRAALSPEVSRLRAHFDSVDSELRDRSVAGLSASQVARRSRLTAWLREYRNAGAFPVNDKFDSPTPFFRDRNGTLCAMAYLIDRSGRSDIVDKVAATRNNAYIAELADDPALIAWLDSSGLSVAEAARIQPQYEGYPFPIYENRGVESDFALAAVGLGSVSLATSAFNMVRPSYVSGLLGIVAGAVSIGVAANHFDDNRATDRVATAVVGLGAVSLGAGVYGLLEARRNDAGRDYDRRRGRGRRKISMTVVPDVEIRAADPRLGFRIGGRF